MRDSIADMHTQETISSFKWPVTVTQPIAASSERVWDVISTPGNLETCHPFCEANPVRSWPGPNSHDEVHYLSGWVYERRFVQWLEGVGYDLEIGRTGGGQSFVSWRIASVDPQNCTLTISVLPHTLQNLPTVIRWLPFRLRMRPMLEFYLSAVLRGFEWYITRDEPVPRDQFGRHPWFSAS